MSNDEYSQLTERWRKRRERADAGLCEVCGQQPHPRPVREKRQMECRHPNCKALFRTLYVLRVSERADHPEGCVVEESFEKHCPVCRARASASYYRTKANLLDERATKLRLKYPTRA